MPAGDIMTVKWVRGSFRAKGGVVTPCLLSWVNECPLVVPLIPAFPRSERARFTVEGHYEGNAADIEEACEQAVRVALFAGREGSDTLYPTGREGIERFLREWGAGDPPSEAHVLLERESHRERAAMGEDGPRRMEFPDGALSGSPLSRAAAAEREAGQASALAAMPSPDAFEGRDAELMRVAHLLREAAGRHPEANSSLRVMADKSALRMIDAVRGETDMEGAAALMGAVAGLMLKVDEKASDGRGWLDRAAFEAAVEVLKAAEESPVAASSPSP